MIATLLSEKEPESPGMLRRIGSGVGVGAQWLLHLLRDAIRVVKPTSKSDSHTGRGIRAKIWGWPPPKLDPARETAWLDGLRGLAAALVMVYHFNLDSSGPLLEAPYGAEGVGVWDLYTLPFLRLFVCSGHAQVCIFFVLSGFVLSWKPLAMIRSGAQPEKLLKSLGSAAFRRWFRLFIPCLAISFCSMLLFRQDLVVMSLEKRETIWGQIWDWIEKSESFTNPFNLERSGFAALHQYLWVTWTIPYEWAGSLLVFLLLLAVSRMRCYRRRTIVIFTVLVYAIRMCYWNYWLFTTGMLIADYVRQAGGFEKLTESTTPRFRYFLIALLTLGLWLAGVPEHNVLFDRPGYEYLYSFHLNNLYNDPQNAGRFWWSWAATFIVFAACHLRTMRRIFELAFIRYLGRLSFMLYLVHRTLFELFPHRVRLQLRVWWGDEVYVEKFDRVFNITHQPITAGVYVATWAVALPIVFAVANWAEILVDSPSVRFSRWLDDQFTREPALPEAPQDEAELSLLPR